MKPRILYAVIDGEITGGNMICLKIIEEGLKRGYPAVVNSPTEGKFTDILRGKDIKVYNIDTRRTFRFDSAIKLAYIIKGEGINLVHTHTPLSGVIISRIAAKLTNVPIINHEHGLSPLNSHPIIKQYQLFLNAITLRMVQCRIIAVSKSTMQGLIQRRVPKDIIRLVYNGVFADDERITNSKFRDKLLASIGLPVASFIIGQVARIDEKKGQHILIRAAEKVIKEFADAIFLIVGEDFENGIYRKKLETLAKNLDIIDHIIFMGYHPDIINLMHAFDLFVLPSLVEGLPVVILEAMAAKKPVITTSVGGNTEIVVDGQTGTLIPPEDSDKLAKAIIYHLNNPEISKRMGEKGYERVKNHFSLSQMLDKVMNIYEEVIRDG